MSNHFTGLSLGPPLGDQRLDLCDLYAFQSPSNPDRTAIILNANPEATALHPDAIYRLAIDNDGDLLNNISFSFVFSEPGSDGSQTFDVFLAKGAEAQKVTAVGDKILSGATCSFGTQADIHTSGDYTIFAGARSDAFFFDYPGIQNLFSPRGERNFTALQKGGSPPWTGEDSNVTANVFSMAIELPTSELGANPEVFIWGRCSVRVVYGLLHVDRAGHPSVSSFFNTDDTKEQYNASEPKDDVERWTDMFVHLIGHTGDYTREEALAAIADHRLLPDMLAYDPSKKNEYPNGRVFTDDVINFRLAFLSKGDIPPTGLSPHTDTLDVFPYLGNPHPATK